MDGNMNTLINLVAALIIFGPFLGLLLMSLLWLFKPHDPSCLHWKAAFEHERANAVRLRKIVYDLHPLRCGCQDCQLVRTLYRQANGGHTNQHIVREKQEEKHVRS